MSEPKRKVLFLVVDGLPPAQRPDAGADAELLVLSQSNGREALEKIFAADSVSVWGEVR